MTQEMEPWKTAVIIGVVVVIIGGLLFFVGRQQGDRTGKKFKVVLSGPNATMKIKNAMPAGWVPGRPGSVNRVGQPGGGGRPPGAPAQGGGRFGPKTQ